MERLICAAVVAVATVLAISVFGSVVNADSTDVTGGHGAFGVAGAQTTDPSGSGGGTSATPSAAPTYTVYTPCAGDGACPHFACAAGQVPAYYETGYQPGSGELGSGPVCLGGQQVSLPAAVATAFRRIPVPTPALHIQPVNGRTLVNFKTNFYATGGQTFTKTVHLLGHTVTLRIHVARYDVSFGDGQHLTTSTPGGPYPQLTNTHEYRRKGTVHPTLTTTWSADYKTPSSSWQPVSGTVTQQTPPQTLEVTTARPVLVNPSGPPS